MIFRQGACFVRPAGTITRGIGPANEMEGRMGRGADYFSFFFSFLSFRFSISVC